MTGAGHHIFADKPEVFNQFVNEACEFSDNLPENPSCKYLNYDLYISENFTTKE